MRLILVIFSHVIAFQFHCASRELLVYIGTYTRTEEQGIHWLRLDMGTGKLTASGELKPTGYSIKVPIPVCVKFLDLPGK